jgi:hypothetical protein
MVAMRLASASASVRCFSASNSRTFSIAITAWLAKVSTSAICLSRNGRISIRRIRMTAMGVPSRSNGVASVVRWPSGFACLLPTGRSPPQNRINAETRSSTNPWESSRFNPSEIRSKCARSLSCRPFLAALLLLLPPNPPRR